MTRTYYRKAWEVVGYTGDADMYCPECAVARYGEWIVTHDVPDNEGNNVMAVFLSDEHDGAVCGDCHAPID